MTGRRELRCEIHPLNSLSPLRFVVVCSFYQGKRLLSYHAGHRAWETQGGHIEAGESPLEAARREIAKRDKTIATLCDINKHLLDETSKQR